MKDIIQQKSPPARAGGALVNKRPLVLPGKETTGGHLRKRLALAPLTVNAFLFVFLKTHEY
jgi:hypothetical protein